MFNLVPKGLIEYILKPLKLIVLLNVYGYRVLLYIQYCPFCLTKIFLLQVSSSSNDRTTQACLYVMNFFLYLHITQ